MSDEADEQTIARLEERLAKLDRERQRVMIAIATIRGDVDDGSLPEDLTSDPDRRDPSPIIAPAKKIDVRPDKFFGMTYPAAARAYLRGVGHADTIENIFNAITAGGVQIGGANPVATLSATIRQNARVFVRVGKSTIGLREFYPHMTRGSEPDEKGRAKAGRGKK